MTVKIVWLSPGNEPNIRSIWGLVDEDGAPVTEDWGRPEFTSVSKAKRYAESKGWRAVR